MTGIQNMDPFDRVLREFTIRNKQCPVHGCNTLIMDLYSNNQTVRLLCGQCNNALLAAMSSPKYLLSAIENFKNLAYHLTRRCKKISRKVSKMTVKRLEYELDLRKIKYHMRDKKKGKEAKLEKYFNELNLKDFERKEYELVCHGFVGRIEKRHRNLNVPVYLTNVIIKYYDMSYDSATFFAWKRKSWSMKSIQYW